LEIASAKAQIGRPRFSDAADLLALTQPLVP
jgi:hypothetical protein